MKEFITYDQAAKWLYANADGPAVALVAYGDAIKITRNGFTRRISRNTCKTCGMNTEHTFCSDGCLAAWDRETERIEARGGR